MLNNQHLHKYMIHSPATVLLIVRKCWQHIALVDINLEVLGQLLHVGEGAPDGVEVEDDAPEHHAPHDVSAEADAHHTQDQDLLAEVLDSSQVAAVVFRDDQQHLLLQSVHLSL